MAAALAPHFEIHPHPQHQPLLTAAGMGLFIFKTSFTWMSTVFLPPSFHAHHFSFSGSGCGVDA